MRVARIAGLILVTTMVLACAKGQAKDEPPPFGTPGATKAWNPEEVAVLADQLASAIQSMRNEIRSLSGPGMQTMQANSWFRLQDFLRLLENESRSMAARARDGHSEAQMRPMYGRMGVTVRNAQEEARRLLIPVQLQKRIDVARGLLDQLDAYFM